MKKSTCVSEVRPPVGSYVVVGKFELLRPVRLLDLGALSDVFIKVSYFNPEYASLKGRAAFLQHLVNEISKPVMPRDVDREYLSTQFVASYLAHKVRPHLDGIIFPSSQTEDNGHNVVFFNRSRGVEPSNLPSGTVVDVSLPHRNQDDGDFDYAVVFETVPSEVPGEEKQVSLNSRQHGPIRLCDFNEPEETEPYSARTLRLSASSVEYLRIKGVDYSSSSHRVSRHRQTDEERAAFEKQFEQGGENNFEEIFPEDG